MDRRVRLPLAAGAALLAPLALAALLIARGYQPWSSPHEPVKVGQIVGYVGSLALVGAGLAVAAHRGLRATVAVGLVIVIAAPWLVPFDPVTPFPPLDVFDFVVAAVFLPPAVALVAGGEVLVRWPRRTLAWATPRAVLVASTAGVVHAGLAVFLRSAVFEFSWSPLYGAWMILGAVLLGSIPAFAFARFRLVSPAFFVATAFAWSTYETWAAVASPYPAVSISPFTLYLMAWFVVLAVAAVVGALEYAFQAWFGGSRPWTSVSD